MDSETPKDANPDILTERAGSESRVRIQVSGNLEMDCAVLDAVQGKDGAEISILRVEQVATASGDKVETIVTAPKGSTKPVAE